MWRLFLAVISWQWLTQGDADQQTKGALASLLLMLLLDPNDPKVIEQAIKDGIPLSVIEAAQQSPVYKMAMECHCADR